MIWSIQISVKIPGDGWKSSSSLSAFNLLINGSMVQMSFICILSHLYSMPQAWSRWWVRSIHQTWAMVSGVLLFCNCWESSVVCSHPLQRWGQPRICSPGTALSHWGVPRSPSLSRSTKGTSQRGSPTPAAMSWSGFLRVVITNLFRQACVHPQLALGWGSAVGGGGVSILERKHKAVFGENPSILPLGAPLSMVPPPCSHHVGSPFAGAAAMEPGKEVIFHGFCNSYYLGIFLGFVLCPFVSVKWLREEHISAGEHASGLIKMNFILSLSKWILVTCGPMVVLLKIILVGDSLAA